MTPAALLAVVAASAALAAVLTPLMGRLARSRGLVSAARVDRWGSRSTPLLGGLAIFMAVLAPLAVVGVPSTQLLAIVAGTAAAATLGLIDDVRGLRPTSKLVGQVMIASGLALAGIRAEIVPFPPLAFLLTVLWIVALMNAMNLVDNMDGLAAGIAAIAAGVLLVMSPAEPSWIGVLAAGLVGACVGFLVHNFAPARVYMGDAGSMALGFLLASLSLLLTNAAASNVGLAILAPLLVLGLPIFDTALVTLIRGIEGRPVSQGGRDHTSHRLAALGIGERAVVIALYVIAGGFAVLGLMASAIGLALLPLLVLVVVGLILFGTFLAEVPTSDVRVPRPSLAVQGAAHRLARFGAEIGLDLTLATTALLSAFLIRFEALPAVDWMPLFMQAAPIVVPLQLAAFVLFGVYRTLWRYVGVSDIMNIALGSAAGTVVAAFLMLVPLELTAQSRGVLLMDGILLSGSVAGSRFFLRWLRDWVGLRSRSGGRRVVIVGANETGQFALRMLLRSRETAYEAAGFIDDDPGKQWRRIGGIPVIGRLGDLDRILERVQPHLVILAVEGQEIDAAMVRERCTRSGIEIREFVRAI